MPRLNVKPLDILIFFLVIGAGIFLTVRAGSKKGAVVIVKACDSRYEYSARKNGIHSVQGELGETIFEIKDGKVRIIDSPCPNKTCVHQGWHSPLVCLPNNVIITLSDEGEFDGISE